MTLTFAQCRTLVSVRLNAIKLSVIMLSFIMLSVIMLSVIMLSVITLNVMAQKRHSQGQMFVMLSVINDESHK